MLVGRPITGDVTETLAQFLTAYDGVVLQTQVSQDASTGVLTIGYGYPLFTSTKATSGKIVFAINPNLAHDFGKTHKFSSAEIKLLDRIAADLTAKKVSKAVSDFTGRASGLLSFTITGGADGDQAEMLLRAEILRESSQAHLGPIQSNKSMAGTYELIALRALAYESRSLVTAAIRNAVTAGQRAIAWLDIVMLDQSKGKTNRLATETLRIAEANEFGLYSGGASTTSVKEAVRVYEFLGTHLVALKKFLAGAGEPSSEIAYIVSQAYTPADAELWAAYGADLYYHSTTNVAIASDKGGQIVFGAHLPVPLIGGDDINDYNALVVGGKGADRLLISGDLTKTLGYGQTILFVSGGGKDTVNAAGLKSYETIEIAAGPGIVDVVMPKAGLEILKIDNPATFKGKITGFVSGEVLDLVGMSGATTATLSKTGVLTVAGSGETAHFNLGPAARFAGYKFQVQSDGSTGVDVSLVPRGSTEITFSEYAIGTIIKDQYQKDGVVFLVDKVKSGGKTTYSPCEIYADDADPTSPALANFAHGDYSGPILGKFVDPNTGANGTVKQFSFDAGYFNDTGTTLVEWFNAKHKMIGEEKDTTLGYEHFNIASATPIASFEIVTHGKEASGFSFDNLIVGHVTG
jgi:hypothetical protein